jgi:isovaleryl-CoA dehydrogenase
MREQFGRPISSFQMVQSKLAEIYTEVETARALGYRALAACVGLPRGAGGRGEIHKLTAAACLYAGEAFNKAVTEACHIHGGSGYMQDTEINRLFRANKLLEIGAGTSEVRKIIIAEELLRA